MERLLESIMIDSSANYKMFSNYNYLKRDYDDMAETQRVFELQGMIETRIRLLLMAWE